MNIIEGDNSIFPFERLIVWQKAKDLYLEVSKTTKTFPDSERYGLISQSIRSASSICANIAEGSSRRTNKDKIRFMNISLGSGMELANHLILSYENSYINNDQLIAFKMQILEIIKMLNGLIKKYEMS